MKKNFCVHFLVAVLVLTNFNASIAYAGPHSPSSSGSRPTPPSHSRPSSTSGSPSSEARHAATYKQYTSNHSSSSSSISSSNQTSSSTSSSSGYSSHSSSSYSRPSSSGYNRQHSPNRSSVNNKRPTSSSNFSNNHKSSYSNGSSSSAVTKKYRPYSANSQNSYYKNKHNNYHQTSSATSSTGSSASTTNSTKPNNNTNKHKHNHYNKYHSVNNWQMRPPHNNTNNLSKPNKNHSFVRSAYAWPGYFHSYDSNYYYTDNYYPVSNYSTSAYTTPQAATGNRYGYNTLNAEEYFKGCTEHILFSEPMVFQYADGTSEERIVYSVKDKYGSVILSGYENKGDIIHLISADHKCYFIVKQDKDQYYVCDSQGKRVSNTYSSIKEISPGKLRVYLNTNQTSKYGVIDYKGNIIEPLR